MGGDASPKPIGFGPIAAAWPLRRNKLGRNHFDRDFARVPFGDGFDPAFFQVAPTDQRLESLRSDERISLTNLHAKHSLLVTALPGTKPRARIELSGVIPKEIALSPDTLWIDTDRAICTMTYRGKVDVQHPEQEGRVLVAIATSDQPIQWSKIAPPPHAPSVAPPGNPGGANKPAAVSIPAAPLGAVAAAPASMVAPPVLMATPQSSIATPPVLMATPQSSIANPPVSMTAPPHVAKPGSIVMPSPSVPLPPVGQTRAPLPPSPGNKNPPESVPSIRRPDLRDTPPPGPKSVAPGGENRPQIRPKPEGAKPRSLPVPLAITPTLLEDEPSGEGDFDIEITMSEGANRTLDQTGPLAPFAPHSGGSGKEDRALPFQPAPSPSRPSAASSRSGLPPEPGQGPDWFVTPAFGNQAAKALPPPPPSLAMNAPPVFGLPPMDIPTGERSSAPDWVETGALPALDSKTTDIPAPLVPLPALISSPPPQSPHAWAQLGGAPLSPPPVALPIAPPAILQAPPPEGAFGLFEASNAAAARHDIAVKAERSQTPHVADGRNENVARPNVAPPDAITVELIWFDLTASPLLSQNAIFAKFKRPIIEKVPATENASNEKGGNEAAAEKPGAEAPSLESLLRAHVYEVLSRGSALSTSNLDLVLDAAEEESPPPPALTLVSGLLELCLDEIEMLKATVLAATPLASSDKKLKEQIELATEALKSPMLGMPDFAQGLSLRVRDAWGKANRLLPADHLSVCTERLLLEQRFYQKRDLLDDTWIRALLLSPGAENAVPTYLPARIAKRLPLYKRFPARVLGEVVWQQDQYETHPLAIRALALGRLPQRQKPRTRARGAQ